MSAEPKPRSRAWLWYSLTVLGVAGVTFLVTALLMNIRERKREGQQQFFPILELTENSIDPELWRENFPRQYDSFSEVETRKTKYGGSEPYSKLDADPRWKRLFAGYAFAVDYNEERGHPFMLIDQKETRRVKEFKQTGACLHCHSSVVSVYRKEGGGDVWKGFEKVCKVPLKEEGFKLVSHPISCIDCHDPKTLKLRAERPAFLEGIKALAQSDDPVPFLPSIEKWRKGNRKKDYDPNELASRQEMRTFVCAQCHVEYYFKGSGKLVTYPWKRGLKADQMEEYYDKDAGAFKDWEHQETQAPMLKAQHPDFELWSQGIHARSGVSCADCHMPYVREGAIKVSDHHVRSPLLTINRSCQTCHRHSEQELKDRTEIIQDRTHKLMIRAEEAVLALMDAVKEARKKGAKEEDLKEALQRHRKAQWRVDFVAAENSMGFHAGQEAARLLGEAIDYARQGEVIAVKATVSAK
jgi:nitrite reductase (cytochrome c-552)